MQEPLSMDPRRPRARGIIFSIGLAGGIQIRGTVGTYMMSETQLNVLVVSSRLP